MHDDVQISVIDQDLHASVEDVLHPGLLAHVDALVQVGVRILQVERRSAWTVTQMYPQSPKHTVLYLPVNVVVACYKKYYVPAIYRNIWQNIDLSPSQSL